MKKHIFSAFVPLLLICIMTAQVAQAAEPRAAGAFLDLSFDGTTAICSTICRGEQTSDELAVTLTLYQGSTRIKSWSEAGTWKVNLSGEHKVISGKTYRLEVIYAINGIEKPSVSTTATCP